MSMVLVLIETDHEDHKEAVKSVAGAMERAGYNVANQGVTRLGIMTNGWVQAVEPEVEDARRG